MMPRRSCCGTMQDIATTGSVSVLSGESATAMRWARGSLTRQVISRGSSMKVAGGSFLSSQDPRLVLGIGTRPKLDWLEVKWPRPSGATERFTNLPIDRYVTLVEGTGKWT